MLKPSIKALSLLLILSSCNTTDTLAQPDHYYASILDINELTAIDITDNTPWDYFTDFETPYLCSPSEQEPELSEAAWVTPETVWQRIRLGYQINWQEHQQHVEAEFNWYQSHPTYLNRVSKRAHRYIYYVTEQLARNDMPLELALLPIVESAYDPFAYSHGRASGMWQFIPGTGRMYKLKQNWWYDGRRDIVDSTSAAINYLSALRDYYDGDWLLALAAYNSGQGNVNKAIRKNKKLGKPTTFWDLDLPAETRSYVPKLLALAKIIENPQRYGIELKPIPNSPYFAEIETQSQIDLAQAASMAEIDIDELYRLNPGFNRWATAPAGPHRLLVPLAHKARMEQQVAQLPPEQRLHWQRYTVKNGDSLLLLAKRFNTDTATIQSINQIRGNLIRTGQSLMIPTASEQAGHYSLSAQQRKASIQKKRKGGSNSKQQFHTVRSGDSLWTIARQYDVTTAKLAHWNGIAPKDILQPGQKLSVWVKNTASSPANQREAIVKKVGYKVRSGDSLARIAGKFSVDVSDIVKWNSVNPKSYLQPGQLLTLFVDITNAYN